MNRDESLKALQSLLELVQQYEETVIDLKVAANDLRMAQERTPVAVAEFDKKNKGIYLSAHVGPEPEQPKGIMKVTLPFNYFGKKRYDKEYDDYWNKIEYYSKEYYNEYAEQRAKINAEEQAEIDNEIQSAQNQVNRLIGREKSLKKFIQENSLLSDNFKNRQSINTLIKYFQDHRVDSLKEAANLYFEEEHRSKLEEYAQEQLRLTKEAKRYAEEATSIARKALSIAEGAASNIDSALSLAQNAMNRADEAFDKANDLCDKADEAFDKANEAYDKVNDLYLLYRADEAYDKAEEAYNKADEAYWAATLNDN